MHAFSLLYHLQTYSINEIITAIITNGAMDGSNGLPLFVMENNK